MVPQDIDIVLVPSLALAVAAVLACSCVAVAAAGRTPAASLPVLSPAPGLAVLVAGGRVFAAREVDALVAERNAGPRIH